MQKVTLITKARARYDVDVSQDVKKWMQPLQDSWLQRGVRVDLLIDPHVHSRWVSLVGLGGRVDIHLEWGLNLFADLSQHRITRRTEVLVLETEQNVEQVRLALHDAVLHADFWGDLALFQEKSIYGPKLMTAASQ